MYNVRNSPPRPYIVDASPRRPRVPSPEVRAGYDSLRPADYGTVHPDFSGIRTRREPGYSGERFADFTRDVRESVHELSRSPADYGYAGNGYGPPARESMGHQAFREVDELTARLNPGARPTPYYPSTSIDIYPGTGRPVPMSQVPRNEGTYESVRPAYRRGGQPGAGRPSDIYYDEAPSRRDKVAGLGHESVHAWRSAHGIGVSPLRSSQHHAAPVFSDPLFDQFPEHRDNAREAVGERLRLTEEFETMGVKPTPYNPSPTGRVPTDNGIRRERGYHDKVREDYSGHRPGGNSADDALRTYDATLDDRKFYERAYRRAPLDSIVYDLER